MDATSYIGIDVSRNTFDAVIHTDSKHPKHKVFDNNSNGFNAFLKWVGTPPEAVYAGMESTNAYWEDLASFLHENGSRVSIINPKCLKGYGNSRNIRGKTDKTDAVLIARYTAKEHPRLWQPARPNERTLLLQMRQLEHMKSAGQKERVRISMMKDPLSKQIAARIADFIQTEIRTLEQQIAELIRNDEIMNQSAKLLKTVPGIGTKTLPWLLAYLGDGSRFRNGKAAATCAGLTPMPYESGTSVSGRTRISKIGNSEIRKAMYMPAMVYACGRMKNGVFRPFTERLAGNGKTQMEIIIALMRKMVAVAQAVLKSGRPFDPALHTDNA